MSLLAPWALWLTPVAVIVVGLYLLKIRRTRQVVPSIEFWMRLAEEPPVRSLLRRLKRLLSLLLWLIIIAAVLFAVGNPVLAIGKAKPRAIVVIIDNSVSMLTHESESGNATRIQLAKRAVADLTSRRPLSDEWLLIEAAQQPRVAQSWTHDRRLIREAADAIIPHSGSNDLAESLVLARQLLTGKQRPTIVLVSDGGDGAWNTPTPDVELIHWTVGQTDDNLGVTRIYVRHNRQEESQQVYVAIVNASQVEVEADLIFELDDSPIGVEPIVIEPGGTWEKTTSFRYPNGGVLRAYIDRADALPEDDGAYAILQPVRAARVLLVSAEVESYFIAHALAAMPTLVDLDASRSVTPDGYVDSLTEDYDLVNPRNSEVTGQPVGDDLGVPPAPSTGRTDERPQVVPGHAVHQRAPARLVEGDAKRVVAAVTADGTGGDERLLLT
ncbi:MAG: BatA and WFA domain-containing protein, partial [Planctomycetes bacterium]|nr:BatA and WFA domain-containing protein [Planctomycetota bacterium]